MHESGKGLDAVVTGCRQCQSQRCDGSVGYAGSPDDTGEITIMYGCRDNESMGSPSDVTFKLS